MYRKRGDFDEAEGVASTGRSPVWSALAIPVGLLLGLVGPLIFTTWYTLDLERASLEKAFRLELGHVSNVLANGMREPIWNLIPESGRPILQSVMKDERVLAIRVTSVAQGAFLQAEREASPVAVPTAITRNITYRGGKIGEVTVVIDTSGLGAVMSTHRRQVYIVGGLQLVLSVAVVLFVIRLSGSVQRERVLRGANLKLLKEIEERKRVETALEAAKEEAQLANRAKSEFLANVSHELRTPLNAVIGFSELLLQGIFGKLGNPKHEEYVSDIRQSGQHLLDLITDIIDISRIEAQKGTLEETEASLDQVVGACLSMVRERATSRHVGLEAEMPSDGPYLLADHRKTKQILINLLTNAIKFTPAGGEVQVIAYTDDSGGVVLQVVDNGIGMAPGDIPRALEPFGQVNVREDQAQEGTGLGLPLVKALVRLHGGTLDIDSAVGIGTTVTIRYPPERTVSAPRTANTA